MLTCSRKEEYYENKKIMKNLLPYLKWLKKLQRLAILKVKDTNFTNRKALNIDRIVVTNKVPSGKKVFTYFIGYIACKKVRPLCAILPKMSSYKRGFDEGKYIYFLIINTLLLERYNEIWEIMKVSTRYKKYEKYIKTK